MLQDIPIFFVMLAGIHGDVEPAEVEAKRSHHHQGD